MPVSSLWERSGADDGNTAPPGVHPLLKREDAPTCEGYLRCALSPGSEIGNDRTSDRVLQEGWQFHRARKGSNKTKRKGLLGRRPGPSGSGGHANAEGRVSATLPPVLQDVDEHPSFQLEAIRGRTRARMVVWTDWDWQVANGMGSVSGSLPEACEQVVGWLLRPRGSRHRGMGAEKRVYGGQTEDMGGSLSVSGGDQGWKLGEDSSEKDHSDEQLHYQGVFPE